MKVWRLLVVTALTLAVVVTGVGMAGGAGIAGFASKGAPATPAPFPDAWKLSPQGSVDLPVPGRVQPAGLTHPCGGMFAEPPFSGLAPLAIAYTAGMCGNGYGDIGVWQANGHSYVVQAGFAVKMFHIWNVDDPYNPQLLKTQNFPSGGTASLSAFPFYQNGSYYMAIAMRGSGTGCGFFIFNVDDPANPVQISRKAGADWCTVHETFVSKDANGNADYAWLAMSGESGSAYKEVVLDLRSGLVNPPETGRYQRPDANGSIFIHDSAVIGNRVYLGHWAGGVIVQDKETLAHTINPTPLNPLDSIRPSGFNVHHMKPTTDGRFLFLEDEFANASNVEKIKIYNIENIAAPSYVGGIIGSGVAATSQAHNLIIQPISAGHDRLYVAWYKAGTRIFDVDTTGANIVVTEIATHQLRQTAGSGFGGVWGVDYLPCTLHGTPHTCVYSSDYEKFGLIVDALGEDPTLDPYAPDPTVITNPINGQTIQPTISNYFTITGTAHDYYSGVAQVQFSADNGTTWQNATGTNAWTYTWYVPPTGQYTLKARAVDVAGNVESAPVGITVNVVNNYTIRKH